MCILTQHSVAWSLLQYLWLGKLGFSQSSWSWISFTFIYSLLGQCLTCLSHFLQVVHVQSCLGRCSENVQCPNTEQHHIRAGNENPQWNQSPCTSRSFQGRLPTLKIVHSIPWLDSQTSECTKSNYSLLLTWEQRFPSLGWTGLCLHVTAYLWNS